MKKKIYLTSLFIFLTIISAALLCNKIRLLFKPNIILIMLDAARADHFSCYGYPKNTTPYMDSISRNGALFENHFSQAINTVNSIPKIFFSRYLSLDILQEDAWIWGTKRELPWDIFKRFDNKQILLTNILSSHSYSTAIFSDHAYFYNENNKNFFVNQFNKYFIKNLEIDEFISEITSFIKNNNRFFIYWHILCPHEPYAANIENKEFFDNDADESMINIVKDKMAKRNDDSAEIFSDDEIKCLKGLYDNNLRHADSLIGVLYEKLKKMGVLNNTAIIITSDHGENLGDHNLVGHSGIPWDSLVKVPLIIIYPPFIPHRIRVKDFTESIDIMPTIVDICNIKLPHDKSMDGSSLLKCIKHPNKGKRYALVPDYYTIRTKKYKYLLNRLYDIEEDPEEENNISNKEVSIKEKLRAQYNRIMLPYIERYRTSIAQNQLSYPFYFEIPSLNITPKESIEKWDIKENNVATFLKENEVSKGWLLNDFYANKELLRLPNPSKPITLSANIQNGAYKIYMLLHSPHQITGPIEQLGFRYIINPEPSIDYPNSISIFKTDKENYFSYYSRQGQLNCPLNIELFSNDDDNYYYYIYLGEFLIKNYTFSIQIDFQPPDEKLYALKHIKFIPIKSEDKPNDNEYFLKNNGEFKKERERLKSLGYL